MFIVFEGIDGAGKTTQIQKFCDWLNTINKEYVVTREPGGTSLGKKLRSIILEDDPCELAELGLFLADRAQNIHENIKNSDNQGKIIISDRYTDSTIAYQHFGRKLYKQEQLEILNDIFSSYTHADKTIILDVSFDKAMERITARGELTKFETDKEFFLNVQAYYQSLKNKSNYIYIDTTDKNPNEIFEIIKKEVEI